MLGERPKKELNWGAYLFWLQKERAIVQAKPLGWGNSFHWHAEEEWEETERGQGSETAGLLGVCRGQGEESGGQVGPQPLPAWAHSPACLGIRIPGLQSSRTKGPSPLVSLPVPGIVWPGPLIKLRALCLRTTALNTKVSGLALRSPSCSQANGLCMTS